jgi:hypothetical protein
MLLSLIISITTLYLSQLLVVKIAGEEKKKMEMWAEAESILSDPYSEGDLGFQLRVVQSNTTIPAILVDEKGTIRQSVNVDTVGKAPGFLQRRLEDFKVENEPIVVPVDEKTDYRVYYGSSTVLTQLQYYPYVVLGIVALFMFVSYAAFSYSTRSEQNKVWVGLAKETAHQLGTPISSLMGWVEVMEMGALPENAGVEMRKDIDRLNIITERFSKIGSEPILKVCDFNRVVRESLEYMESRIGRGVAFDWDIPQEPLSVMMNVNLFQWVIENLVKNQTEIYSIDTLNNRSVQVSSDLELSKNLVSYLKNTDSSKKNNLDTYPLTNLNWLKTNVSNGSSIGSFEQFNNTTNSFLYLDDKKTIARINENEDKKSISL